MSKEKKYEEFDLMKLFQSKSFIECFHIPIAEFLSDQFPSQALEGAVPDTGSASMSYLDRCVIVTLSQTPTNKTLYLSCAIHPTSKRHLSDYLILGAIKSKSEKEIHTPDSMLDSMLDNTSTATHPDFTFLHLVCVSPEGKEERDVKDFSGDLFAGVGSFFNTLHYYATLFAEEDECGANKDSSILRHWNQ